MEIEEEPGVKMGERLIASYVPSYMFHLFVVILDA